jgi:DnaJ-class molecular chaperone
LKSQFIFQRFPINSEWATCNGTGTQWEDRCSASGCVDTINIPEESKYVA